MESLVFDNKNNQATTKLASTEMITKKMSSRKQPHQNVLESIFLKLCSEKAQEKMFGWVHITKIDSPGYETLLKKTTSDSCKSYFQIFNKRFFPEQIPVNTYLFKGSHRNTKKRYGIYSKLTIKTPEQHNWHRSGVFIVNFEYISHHFLVFYCWLWTSKSLMWCKQLLWPIMLPTDFNSDNCLKVLNPG